MKRSGVWSLIFAAFFFVALYAAVAYVQNNFSFPNYDYAGKWNVFMGGIPSPEMQSQMWKFLLLLPAIILCSVAYVRSGIRLSFPWKPSYRTSAAGILTVAAILLIISTETLFRETEVTDDENTYDFQAKTLLAGRLTNPPPPVKKSFDNVFLINDGHTWVGKYTLGHPAVIAVGMFLGDRYIAIIAISILTLLLISLIAKELYGDEKLSLLVLCLGAVSPFFYMVSSSRLSHTTSAFFLALFLYTYLRSRRTGDFNVNAMLSFIAGIALGYAFNTRTATTIGFMLPFAVVLANDIRKNPKKSLLSGFFLGAGFLIVFVVTLWYNAMVTGNPLLFPFHYYAPYEALGFSSGHTPLLGLKNFATSIFRLNAALFGFPLSLLFVLFFLIAKKDFHDRMLLAIAGCVSAVYFLYYSPGVSDLGPVYYYELIIPLLIISGRGIVSLFKNVSGYYREGKVFLHVCGVLLCLAAWCTYVPEKIEHISRLTAQIREPYELVQTSNIHHAVVMIERLPYKGWVFGYRSPSPLFTEDVVYCLFSDSSSNAATAEYFHDRNLYHLHYEGNKKNFQLLPLLRKTL